ncbi:hypothetical protein M3Y99_01551800 [Aphelenchoides fujianensis]|nr:hypothetical protein M3Y99_01551800 [Aphelenchoides fujianensis]
MAPQLQGSSANADKASENIADLKKRIRQQEMAIGALIRQSVTGRFSEDANLSDSTVEAKIKKNEQLKRQLQALEEEQSRIESQENRQAAVGGAIEAELAALRAGLQQMTDDLEAAKQGANKWMQKYENERARADAAENHVIELERKLKAALHSCLQEEGGSQQKKPRFATTFASSSLKPNGERYKHSSDVSFTCSSGTPKANV